LEKSKKEGRRYPTKAHLNEGKMGKIFAGGDIQACERRGFRAQGRTKQNRESHNKVERIPQRTEKNGWGKKHIFLQEEDQRLRAPRIDEHVVARVALEGLGT